MRVLRDLEIELIEVSFDVDDLLLWILVLIAEIEVRVDLKAPI